MSREKTNNSFVDETDQQLSGPWIRKRYLLAEVALGSCTGLQPDFELCACCYRGQSSEMDLRTGGFIKTCLEKSCTHHPYFHWEMQNTALHTSSYCAPIESKNINCSS